MSDLRIAKLDHPRKLKIPKQAKVVIVGLTPGRVQHNAINEALRPREGAFKGAMRTRLFRWFEELGINEELEITHKDDIFLKKKYEKLVFMTSLLREPVYYANGKNYSGRQPYPWKDERLAAMIQETVEILKTAPKEALIIPCGSIVSKSLVDGLAGTGLSKNLLVGFPHPSGLNAHGPKKFEESKKQFVRIVHKTW